MSNSSLRLESAASFHEKCNRRCGLVVVYRSDFDTGTVNNSGKVTRYALNCSGRRPRCKHGEKVEELEGKLRMNPEVVAALT